MRFLTVPAGWRHSPPLLLASVSTSVSLALFTLAAVLASADAGVPIEVSVSPRQVMLGEPFTVQLVIHHPPSERWELLPPASNDEFEALGATRSRTDDGATSTTTLAEKFSAFELGTKSPPELTLEVMREGEVSRVTVPSGTIEVISSLPADAGVAGAELLDVLPLLPLWVRTYRVVWGLLAVGAAIIAALFIRRYLRRPRPVAPPVALTLHERTVAALAALEAARLPAEGSFQEYYFRLSEILRGYLGERFHIDALESTTPELLAALRMRATPGLSVADLEEFATLSDFVRYARAQPTPRDCDGHMTLARRIVSLTHPPPEGPPRARN